MAELMQKIWWVAIAPFVFVAIFYWPGRFVLRLITNGRYPPPDGKGHNVELVALVAIALCLTALTVYYS
jgi:hypothetical protein